MNPNLKPHLNFHLRWPAASFLALALLIAPLGLQAEVAWGQMGGGTVRQGSKPQAPSKAQPKPSAGAKKKAEPGRPTLPPREPFTAADEAKAVIPGIPNARFWGDSESDFERALPTVEGPWLILSTGGGDGAFGAGLLTGWRASGNLPDFSLVTGVSTGALMAPFVFAGAKYDAQLREAYTTINSGDVFELGATPESLLDTWPLKELVAKRVTPELLADIAAEYRKGRRLFVTTTNLDAERPVVWNLGAIAEKGGEDALRLVRAVLVAATSIPGAFPPVLIGAEADGHRFSEMHSDGGLAAQFYLAPESLIAGTSSYRLKTSGLYIIVNTKLSPDFDMTDRSLLPVLARAVSVGVKAATRAMIDRAYAVAQRSGAAFNLAYIDPDFSAASQGPFDSEYMKALFDFGLQQGKKADPFTHEPPLHLARPSVTKPSTGAQ